MKLVHGWLLSFSIAVIGLAIPANASNQAVGITPSFKMREPLYAEITVSNILQERFAFGETGARVKSLQKTIGTVLVDGIYGSITRREHIEALQINGLPIDNIPSLPSASYNIPSDKSQRCPQWEPIMQEIGLEPIDVFSYIAYRESHCSPVAQNATWDKNGNQTYRLNKGNTYDTGLLQINSSWKSSVAKVCGKDALNNHLEGLKDIRCNLMFAKYIMDNSLGKLGNWNIYQN